MQKVNDIEPFDEPGFYETGENKYEVIMTLEGFMFTPSEMEILAGSEVTPIMTSKDVTHWFQIAGTECQRNGHARLYSNNNPNI